MVDEVRKICLELVNFTVHWPDFEGQFSVIKNEKPVITWHYLLRVFKVAKRSFFSLSDAGSSLGFDIKGFGAENRFAPLIRSWPGANQCTSCWWKQLSGSHSIYSSKMHHGGRLIVIAADLLLYGSGLQKKVGEGSNRSTGVHTSLRTWGQSLSQPSYANDSFSLFHST